MTAKPMTKAELVAAISDKTGADKKSTNAAIDAFAEVLTEEVAKGGAVTVPGLGKVAVRDRAARTVRNPSTGEQMEKPADKTVKVTIAKSLKDAANS